MNRAIFRILCIFAAVSFSGGMHAYGQGADDTMRQLEQMTHQTSSGPVRVPKEVRVVVEADKPRGILMPWTLGVHSVVSDSHLTDNEVIPLLRAAGVTTLRYPGGRIADMFHWSTQSLSNWQGTNHPNAGYAPASNVGSFLRLAEQVGTAIFTVNYGSNPSLQKVPDSIMGKPIPRTAIPSSERQWTGWEHHSPCPCLRTRRR